MELVYVICYKEVLLYFIQINYLLCRCVHSDIMKVYNKLVRDKIPEIIKADGKECKTRILSKDEYIAALETKLNEEVAEYQEDKNLEEMADVLEVLQAICLARGYSLDELEAMRIKKAKERGGFKDKIFLEYVAEKR